MHFTVEPTPDGKWTVIDLGTGKPFGDPVQTLEEAAYLIQVGEAYHQIEQLAACRGAACSA
ncbi:hypothetical protein GCM10011491_41830 [Brucella endophytica]|uniref:Uncharacterized protein n=1 Tax=Brucella endophytica TaxID=1963359 RepID=A0A916SPQ5_9HYPH|nr:hypothetical protein [Brucella endophytica]GGB09482.1 hypothetical protein GCM10011491_41830 [Brucella endophytica]